MPRKKTHLENRRTWPRVAISPELADILSVLLASRRLPLGEAHQLIEEALKNGLADEYNNAKTMLARFNHSDE